jgi:uncharacterized phiE125 gp8 family phage protein
MAEPVTLAEARAQVDIIDAAETTFDTFLTSLIAPARAYIERESRFFWVAATRSETFNAWGDGCVRHWRGGWQSRNQFLEIYRRPIASLGGITYTDEAGADQTLDASAYLAPLVAFPFRIYPAIGSSFPALGAGGRITVEYTSGALDSTSEEYLLGKRAMLLLIGHWFANRESVIADTRAVSVEVQEAVADILNSLGPVSAY